jgi:hypothetical protein
MKFLTLAIAMLLSSPALAVSGEPVRKERISIEKDGPLVLATRQVVGPKRLPVLFAYRLKPNNENDSGWVFWSGQEDQAYIDNTDNTVVSLLGLFLDMDPTLAEILNHPIGTAWARDSPASPWREVPGYVDGP